MRTLVGQSSAAKVEVETGMAVVKWKLRRERRVMVAVCIEGIAAILFGWGEGLEELVLIVEGWEKWWDKKPADVAVGRERIGRGVIGIATSAEMKFGHCPILSSTTAIGGCW